ncbi:MAG TPA: hypothetical protein VHE80_09400 [Acidimicrobiales bacterium]|nr:hypothetical protein [Acidimicrobiales bacterium]
MSDAGPAHDPVEARRARMARLAGLGQSVGYGLLAVAVVVFAAGAATGFTTAIAAVVTAALAGATLTLAPAIVLGYAVKAAEREDRRSGRT